MSDQNHETALVLSVIDGHVWASWRDGRPQVRLGPYATALLAMDDFVRQSELAERLLSLKTDAPN